jgi:RimJ/RimL family protein N-acetyltransferase
MSQGEPERQVIDLRLRPVVQADLPIFYEQHRDPVAVYMAAFTAKDPDNKEAFAAHWSKISTDPTIISRTVLYGDQVAGSISSFEIGGEREISYWLGREFWNQGLATAVLAAFLQIVTVRPLYGRAAKDNIGSIRVMQKNGFFITGEDKGFANARGELTEEFILRLDLTSEGYSPSGGPVDKPWIAKKRQEPKRSA